MVFGDDRDSSGDFFGFLREKYNCIEIQMYLEEKTNSLLISTSLIQTNILRSYSTKGTINLMMMMSSIPINSSNSTDDSSTSTNGEKGLTPPNNVFFFHIYLCFFAFLIQLFLKNYHFVLVKGRS